MAALFDHPEPNYTVCTGVCEFWSVLTTLPIAGGLLACQSIKMGLRWRVRVLAAWICTMYCCACISHWTLIDPLFRVTVTLVVTQGLFVFAHYSYLVSLRLGNISGILAILLEAGVVSLVALLPQNLGPRGGHLSLAVIQTPGVFLGLIAASRTRMHKDSWVHDKLVVAGALLFSAMILSVVEYVLWDNSVLPILGGFPAVHVAIHVLEQVGIYLYGVSVAVLDDDERGRCLNLALDPLFGKIPMLSVAAPGSSGGQPAIPTVEASLLLDPEHRKCHREFNACLHRLYPDAGVLRVLGERSCFLVKSRGLVTKVLKDEETFASHPWPDGRIVALNTMKAPQHSSVKGLLLKFYSPNVVCGIQEHFTQDFFEALIPGPTGAGAGSKEPFSAVTWVGRVHMASSFHALGGSMAAKAASDPSILDQFVRLNEDMVRLVAPLGGIGGPPPSFLRDGVRPALSLLRGLVGALPPLLRLAARLGFRQTFSLVRPDLTLWQGGCFPRTGTWRHPELLRSVPVYFALLDEFLAGARAEGGSTCLNAINDAVDQGLLSKAESLAVVVQLMVNMTTRNAILNALNRLATDYGLFLYLRQDRKRVPAFLREILRADTPLQRTPKRALKDTSVGGVFVPKHSTVLLLLGAASSEPPPLCASGTVRDPGAFCPFASSLGDGAPEEPLASSLAFGPGARHCLGRHLVLAEMEALVNFVLDRADNLHVEGRVERLSDVDVGNFGWKHLDLAFS